MKAGLVAGEHLSVDGSFILANASNTSCVPREHLQELAQVKRTVREYLTELEQEKKNQIRLRRVRLRRLKFVRKQFFLATSAQNLKRLVRYLSRIPKPPLAVTS